MAADLTISVVVIGLDSFHQLNQSSFVFQLTVTVVQVFLRTRCPAWPSPSLDNAVGNPQLRAQGRKEDHQLNGIHIVSVTTS